MSSTEFHIHLGVRDVFPTLLTEVSTHFRDELASQAIHCVSGSDIKKHILGKQKKSLLFDARLSETQVYPFPLRPPEGTQRVVVSGHGLLCDRPRVFSSAGLYADIGDAATNLAKLFTGKPTVLHLTIVPQADYPLVSDSNFEELRPVSWLPLIQQLQDALPNVPIIIWPIERPDVHGVDFVVGITGLDASSLQLRMIGKLASKQRHAKRMALGKSSSNPVADYLDDAYEQDMRTFSSKDGVYIGIRSADHEFSI